MILFRTNWSRKERSNTGILIVIGIHVSRTVSLPRWYTLGTRLKRLVCKTVLEPSFHFLIFSSLRVVLAILDARLSSRTIDLDKLLADLLFLSLHLSPLDFNSFRTNFFFIAIGTINVKLVQEIIYCDAVFSNVCLFLIYVRN